MTARRAWPPVTATAAREGGKALGAFMHHGSAEHIGWTANSRISICELCLWT